MAFCNQNLWNLNGIFGILRLFYWNRGILLESSEPGWNLWNLTGISEILPESLESLESEWNLWNL